MLKNLASLRFFNKIKNNIQFLFKRTRLNCFISQRRKDLLYIVNIFKAQEKSKIFSKCKVLSNILLNFIGDKIFCVLKRSLSNILLRLCVFQQKKLYFILLQKHKQDHRNSKNRTYYIQWNLCFFSNDREKHHNQHSQKHI